MFSSEPTSPQLVVEALQSELGDAVSTDPALLESVRSDKSGWVAPGLPLAVVRARTTAHVQSAMRIATRFRIPVVPRGAGTGLAGGGVGTHGALVISTELMNEILEVNPADELAVVQAGVINQRLSDVVAPHGLVFSPDPASKAISTIGGNIATNAGGLLCAKYGVTREAVLGLVVVLPDGSLLRTGHRSVKGVTGFDLTALLTGSEGTLGVIVEATVRLRPIPPGDVVTLGAFFGDIRDGAAAAAAITAARIRPAVMELMDHASLVAIDAYSGTRLSAGGGAYLLVQTDARGAVDEGAAISEILTGLGADVRLAHDSAEGEALLAVRRNFHPALASAGEVLIEDICVPRSRLADMFAAIDEISRRHGIAIPTIAHAGDGNLHPNFVLPPHDSQQAGGSGEQNDQWVPASVWVAADELFVAAMKLGGTLTGEHGVGVLKKRWLENELGPRSLELQRGIKAVFDPLSIMNPGAVF
ncbi:glycolate oxidase [Agreia bicolorata]|uniref:Glycolate oxidase n=1 Tax=Agreia bicolorata TaxID=110935 RepID=A0A1T4XAH5_9MICO|nr:FAD-linked oxidase C-terminal domain-containing protein [Agreia bicolorata]SKA85881.1 glycolate oxidase [Agreia bicolorata]